MLKLIGLESVVFFVAFPLCGLYMALVAVVGVLNTLTLPFRRERSFAFARPWREIRSLWSVMARHCRYLYHQEYLPRKQAATKERMAQQAERIRQAPRSSHAWSILNLPEFDTVSGETMLVLCLYILPYAAFLPHCFIALVGMISVWGYAHTYGVAQTPAQPPPPVKVVYEPQVADQQEADFGPWLSPFEGNGRASQSDFRNLALFNDQGIVKYSQGFVAPLEAFAPRNTELVTNVRKLPDGQLSFTDQHRRTLRINPNQAFMFMGYDAYVFILTPDAELKAAPAKSLKHGEK